MRQLFLIFISVILISCKKESETNSSPVVNVGSKPNILFIIADDLGKDAIKGYSEGTIKSNTPVLDSIRNSGLLFTNLWVNPTCTPTRASIITGKYGCRTGI